MAKKDETLQEESIFIPQPDKLDKTLVVFVNGRKFELRRGKRNTVPVDVAEVLRNSDYLNDED